MKTQRKQQRGLNSIPTGRWTAYAAAAAASGFAATPTVEATIHYSGLINQRFTGDTTHFFQLDQRSDLLSFKHSVHYYSISNKDGGSAYFHIFAAGASCNGFYTCAFNSDVASVSNLSPGQAISTRPFVPTGGVLASREGYGCGGGPRGQFRVAGAGFIGFKFNNGSGDQYGWARVEMQGYPKNKFKLIDYAYGDVGDRVKAGQKSSGHAPEMESLGGLAIGAAGLRAWRRRNRKESGAL